MDIVPNLEEYTGNRTLSVKSGRLERARSAWYPPRITVQSSDNEEESLVPNLTAKVMEEFDILGSPLKRCNEYGFRVDSERCRM